MFFIYPEVNMMLDIYIYTYVLYFIRRFDIGKERERERDKLPSLMENMGMLKLLYTCIGG